MKRLIVSLDEVPESISGSALSIGNFDGVHAGHRKLIERLLVIAKERSLPSVVVTFDPSPTSILYPSAAPPALTWIEQRADLLFQMGVDYVVALKTDRALLELTAERFFQEILKDRLKLKAIVEGPNFHFGKDRMGNTRLLEELCRSHGMESFVAPIATHDGEWISSSRIRKLIQEGNVEEANHLLTAPYRLRGRVGTGAGRGRQIGFPTANLVDISVLVPRLGVYAGRCSIEGSSRRVALHIGPNPTFGEAAVKIEAHLLDVDLELVSKTIEIEVLERIRDVRKFESVEQLKAQLNSDMQEVRRIVSL